MPLRRINCILLSHCRTVELANGFIETKIRGFSKAGPIDVRSRQGSLPIQIEKSGCAAIFSPEVGFAAKAATDLHRRVRE